MTSGIPMAPSGSCGSNRSVSPWKNVGRHPPSSPSHTVSVLPLIHQRGGWTTPGQASRGCSPRREIPLRGWPTDHIVPTPRVSVSALAAVPMEVEVGALVGCSCAIKPNPSGVRDHGLTEQLLAGPPDTPDH